MKDFPSCFSENGVQVSNVSCTSLATSSSTTTTTTNVSKVKASQNMVTCVYQTKLIGKSRLVIINWTKSLVGHCFSVELEDLSHKCLSRVHVKPSIFSKQKGFKSMELDLITLEVYWDLTNAKFGSTPEPVECFFVGLVCKGELVLLVGDLRKEIIKKTKCWTNSLRLLKREHVFGKNVFGTKVQFKDNGEIHDLRIECDAFGLDDPRLVVRVNSKIAMQVKHLVWKFRGNCSISVEGVPVEVYWDVYNWLFGSMSGCAVFMFQTCSGFEKSSGFCLTLYAWKNE